MESKVIKLDKIWRKLCKKKYGDICETAYAKAKPGVKWFHIFRSLTLWPDFENVNEVIEDEINTPSNQIVISNMQLLPDGILSILRTDRLVYYDLTTMQLLKEHNVVNYNYIGYNENSEMILLHNDNYQLLTIRKKKTYELALTIIGVSMFIILDNVFYYVTFDNMLCKCTYNGNTYTSAILLKNYYNVWALGKRNGVLYIMTKNESTTYVHSLMSDLYTNFICKCNSVSQEIEVIGRYFANHMDWMSYNYEVSCPKRNNNGASTQMAKVLAMCSYGSILLAAFEPGILYIFNSLHTTSLVNVMFSEPLRIYCLLEPRRGITKCKIYKIDVVEGINCHTVVVAMLHKVRLIRFSFKTNEQWLRCVQAMSISRRFNCASSLTSSEETLSITNDEPKSSGERSASSGEQSANGKSPTFSEELTTLNKRPFTIKELTIISDELSSSTEELLDIIKKSPTSNAEPSIIKGERYCITKEPLTLSDTSTTSNETSSCSDESSTCEEPPSKLPKL